MRGTHYISVSKVMHVDNGTEKVPISENQGPLSKYRPPKYGTGCIGPRKIGLYSVFKSQS